MTAVAVSKLLGISQPAVTRAAYRGEAIAAARAGSAKKDRLLSENSALLDAATTRPTRRAGYETTQTQSRSNLQGQGGDSGLAGR